MMPRLAVLGVLALLGLAGVTLASDDDTRRDYLALFWALLGCAYVGTVIVVTAGLR